MSEPLYSVGQSVAVCNTRLTVVIPSTVVTGAEWRYPGQSCITSDGEIWVTAGHWAYLVRDGGINRHTGREKRFAEWCLRPINPDSEYLDQPESVEAPA